MARPFTGGHFRYIGNRCNPTAVIRSTDLMRDYKSKGSPGILASNSSHFPHLTRRIVPDKRP